MRAPSLALALTDRMVRTSPSLNRRKVSTCQKKALTRRFVGRWFTDFWGKTCRLGIVDELRAPNMLLQYSLHEPRRGRDDIRAFMADFRKAFLI